MKFAGVFVLFLSSLLFERALLPAAFGLFIPVSFWAAIVGFLVVSGVRVLWFSVAAGLAASFFNIAFMPATILLFSVGGLVFFLAAAVLEGEGIIRNSIASAFSVFSFQIFQIPIGHLFYPSTHLAEYLKPGDFVLSGVFIISLWIVLWMFQRKLA